jgi:hypothetical protein
VKVEAGVEHRLGEVLAAMMKHQGGSPDKMGNTVIPLLNGTLPQEITNIQSCRAQQLAAVPC